MQKKLIAGLVEVPEIVREYDIDWSKYETSGGSEWLAFFVNELRPTYETARAEANKDLAKIREAEARRNAIRKGLEASAAIAKMVLEYDAAFPNEMNAEMREPLAAWTAATKALTETDPFSSCDSKATVAMIEEDLKYLKATADFFAADFELDAVLYAMYKVEPKYKAKLFRHVIKLLPVVETNRAFITASTSVIKAHTFEIVEPCLEELDKAYAVLSKQLRELKKAAAKATPGFWEKVNQKGI